jgi:hypothetical protein
VGNYDAPPPWGQSGVLSLYTGNPAPPAPTVQLDTATAVPIGGDSLTIMGYELDADPDSVLVDGTPSWSIAVGDSVRLCGVLWSGDRVIDCECSPARCATLPTVIPSDSRMTDAIRGLAGRVLAARAGGHEPTWPISIDFTEGPG